jgi:hypothetical protein
MFWMTKESKVFFKTIFAKLLVVGGGRGYNI